MKTDLRYAVSEKTRPKTKNRSDLIPRTALMWWWSPQLRKVQPPVVPLNHLRTKRHSLKNRLRLKMPQLRPLMMV